ncbi:MAG TPA: hypothetical protein VIH35_05550 [Kiritimatiellia bacterium]|jgi:hypothetical protein
MAASVAFAGVVLSISTLRATPQGLAKVERRAADFARLQALAGDLDRAKAVLRGREGMPGRNAVPVEDLLMSAFPGKNAEVLPRETKGLIDGWSARSVEIVIEDAPLEGVGKLMREAAEARPPWRVAECTITASDRPGYGRVTLLLETLERSSTTDSHG